MAHPSQERNSRSPGVFVDPYPRTTDGYERLADGACGLEEAISAAACAHERRNADGDLVESYDGLGSGTCSEMDRRRTHESIGIPRMHSNAIISGRDEHGHVLEHLDVDRKLESAFSSKKRLVLMVGKVGTGKTLSVLRWLENQLGALYVKARKLCSYVERYDEDRRKLEMYLSCRVLVIDEMGTEREADIDTLADHIHTRYEDALITVGIANLAPSEAMSRYHDPIARRLWAMGEVIECLRTVCPGQRARTSKNEMRRR